MLTRVDKSRIRLWTNRGFGPKDTAAIVGCTIDDVREYLRTPTASELRRRYDLQRRKKNATWRRNYRERQLAALAAALAQGAA